MLVRRALGQDLAALAAARRQFWIGQQQLGLRDRRNLAPDAVEAETAMLLRRARTALLVADEDGALCGYALAALRAAPQLDPPLVRVVEELFVLPEWGGRGLGRALADRAFAEVPAPDGTREQIHVLAGNAKGRTFWERAGFREEVVIMERKGC